LKYTERRHGNYAKYLIIEEHEVRAAGSFTVPLDAAFTTHHLSFLI
jgi:hypothetical protein